MLSVRFRLASLFLVVVFAAVACGSSEPEPTAVDPEEQFLAELGQIYKLRTDALERFEQLLGPVFPTFATDKVQNFVVLNALRDEDLPGLIVEASAMIRALSPPETFSADYLLMTSQIDLQLDLANKVAAAIDDGDLPLIVLRKAELDASVITVLSSLSPRACRGGLSNRPDIATALCRVENLPGGEYGAEVDRIFKINNAEVGSRIALQQGLSDEQLMETLTYVQPAIVEGFGNTIERLRGITPPAEFEVGHQVMLDFFTELRSTALAIDRAVAAGDIDEMQREFVRSRGIAETAEARLPDNYRPFVAPIFGPK